MDKGRVAEEITTEIDKAENYVDIAMYSFTSEPITEATIETKERNQNKNVNG